MVPLLLRTGVLALVLAGLAYRSADQLTRARVVAAHARVDAECRAFRAVPDNDRSDVCTVNEYAPSTFARFDRGKKQLEQAREAIALGDAERARSLVGEVVDIAIDIEKRRTLIAALLSSSLVDNALDLAEEHPRDLDARAIAARAPRWSVEHPLETERLTQMFEVLQAAREMPIGGPLVDLCVADQITQRDVRVAAMQRAALSGDPSRCPSASPDGHEATLCERAADFLHPLSFPGGRTADEETLCKPAADLVKRGKRLQALAPVPASTAASAPGSSTSSASASAPTCEPAQLVVHLHVAGRDHPDDILSIPVRPADTSTRPGTPTRP